MSFRQPLYFSDLFPDARFLKCPKKSGAFPLATCFLQTLITQAGKYFLFFCTCHYYVQISWYFSAETVVYTNRHGKELEDLRGSWLEGNRKKERELQNYSSSKLLISIQFNKESFCFCLEATLIFFVQWKLRQRDPRAWVCWTDHTVQCRMEIKS